MENKIYMHPAAGTLVLGRWFNVITGMVLSAVGLLNLAYFMNNAYTIVLNACLILLGIYFLISGLLLTPGSRFMPRIELDDDGILIKDDFFHRSKYIDWNSIGSIYLGRHKLSVSLHHGRELSFRLKVRQEEIDGKIKNSLKKMTDRFRIDLTDMYSARKEDIP